MIPTHKIDVSPRALMMGCPRVSRNMFIGLARLAWPSQLPPDSLKSANGDFRFRAVLHSTNPAHVHVVSLISLRGYCLYYGLTSGFHPTAQGSLVKPILGKFGLLSAELSG
jgi:hypothetical protein